MGWIKDNLLGGAAKEAANQQTAALRESQDFIRESINEARGDLNRLFPAAQEASQTSFQDAINLLSGALPTQMDYVNQGSMNAQNSLLQGAQNAHNALLGGSVDYSAFQPQSMSTTLPMSMQNLSTFYTRNGSMMDDYAPVNASVGPGGTPGYNPGAPGDFMIGDGGVGGMAVNLLAGGPMNGLTSGLGEGLGYVTPQNPQGQWFDSGAYRSHMDISPLNSTRQQVINPALDPSRLFGREF